MENLLTIKALNVGFKVQGGTLSAVQDLSFSVRKGEIYALVGESGCGKSTAAYSVMGLLEKETALTSGSVDFKGKELLGMPEPELETIRGKEIGMIFQNPIDSLNPVYKSGNQVSEAILLDQVSKPDAWNRVLDLYQEVKIPDAEKRALSFPHELSGGMRQRVMIAMMLSRQPELLICDEPTTALDVTIEAQILDIIRRLRDESQTAFLVITHNFGIVAEIADRVGVMYAGELVEEADVFTIFDEPNHPSTQALMKALPRQSKHQGRLMTIEGVVPR
ncbi:MAG: ABC transporter ATP-binding protein, partial [Firmicutes bacterium]|nr:ABC transporter ATP-binding protein [Bacillota bacterium]